MKHFAMRALVLAIAAMAGVASMSAVGKYTYDSVPGDPLHAKIYTLPNGLKLFMSQNPRAPRIQTYIAVRVGGKNDPAETTGLAHYFEHLMFKGTPNFGTMDYTAEKPMLDKIEALFETYRQTTDSVARAQIYHEIDSISYEASKLAIPNEYDKMMAAIGANGTNAYTSTDVTCYVEDIPSNEIERWAMVQADRFRDPVIRGFHTELETIYEEKNMSLTNDSRKAYEKMLALLFPSHPYGTQTVLGTQTHLKNPSITNIKKYHDQWYVPNNMAICMSGDFDPDEVVDIVTKYFGDLKPNPNIESQRLKVKPEAPITEPLRGEVWGHNAEQLILAWRIPEAKSEDTPAIQMLSDLLSNGSAGLMDLDLDQAQKLNGSGAGLYGMVDQGAFLLIGVPRSGQSLQEVETLLTGEIDKVRRGDFSDDILEAVKANNLLALQQSLVTNDSRANMFVEAFENGESWGDALKSLDRMKKITKKDIVDVANRYLGPNSYVAIAKRQGEPKDELKIAKPQLTPIATNRDAASDFLQKLVAMPVKPIEPQFVNYHKDLQTAKLDNGSLLLYTHNPYNEVFELTFIYETGTLADKMMRHAADLLDYAGTADMTPAQIREEFYKLACSYSVSIGQKRSYIVLTGLSSNMVKAVKLLEKFLKEASVDAGTYSDYIATVEKQRTDAKANQRANFTALSQYIYFTPEQRKRTFVSIDELKAATPEKLLKATSDLLGLSHRVIYYGPESEKQVVAELNENHVKGVKLQTPAALEPMEPVITDESIVYVAPYDAKQLQMVMRSNNGKKFDAALHPLLTAYNEYFGGSMNSIVFQEMREARSLAYSAWAAMSEPNQLYLPYGYMAQISTQNDKLMDAVGAFDDIINNIPESEAAFALAKDGIEKRLRTDRTLDDGIAWSYISDENLGLAPAINADGTIAEGGVNLDKNTFEALPAIKLQDVIDFQKANVKGRTYRYGILGKIEDLDMEALSKIGKVVVLTTEDIFGY